MVDFEQPFQPPLSYLELIDFHIFSGWIALLREPVVDSAGNHLGIIAHGEPATTNIAWGDDDWKTLYITTRDSLGRIPLKIAGIPVPSGK